MRISAPSSEMVNWTAVEQQAQKEVEVQTSAVVEKAQEEFAKLKPGERKTLQIKVGSITISRPRE